MKEIAFLSGTARVLAAERLGITQIPVIRIQHLSDAEKRAFIIADNKLAEMGAWDPDILRSELQFFTDLNIDFDFSVLGFETAEVDNILENSADCAEDGTAVGIAPNQKAISCVGDLWHAGPHWIYCGDALAASSYDKLLNGERARLVFTDPPYNVRIQGHVGGSGSVQHREFSMASGEMAADQFTSFLTNTMKNLATYSLDGSLHYLFMDWPALRRNPCRRKCGLFGTEKHLCLAQDECRHGFALSLPARARLRVQKWFCAPHQQHQSGCQRPKPYQCLGLRRH
jgi:hypothetical protein